MPKSLVIVESPAKAKTIGGFLGKDYVVESSIGHIRDLPKSADDIPEAFRKESWAKLGVDVDHDFKPLYVIDSDKKQKIAELKRHLKDADQLLLATDEDREGEAIAWHLYEVLQPKVPVRRMVFHEITRKAIESALKSPRQIDERLVQAQEARRILDRLVGYEVSPVLWKKVRRNLSAGRVQSVATRILVERERERMKFVAASYWDIDATLRSDVDVSASLLSVDQKRVATGKDFGENGKLTGKNDVLVLGEADARALATSLEGQTFTVRSVERKPYKRSPSAPFMTSTLQQEAGRKLRFGSKRTMKAAQRLYESGFITYMRTDSTTLSEAAVAAARILINELYGREYVPNAPRSYANKVKNAQEAHEAIRPAGDVWKSPDEVAREVGHDEARVYELIWKRTVASQMQDARGESIVVRIEGTAKDGRRVELSTSGNTIQFPGFYRAYVEGSDDPEAELENREKHLPELVEGQSLLGKAFEAKGHTTQPPARYTEASLVRKLEELGVGRPSTYASTMSTIVDRGYVQLKGSAMVPTWTAFAVITLLEKHFPELVDYAFTARMEDDLDEIANGSQSSVPWLRRFYFGGPTEGASDDIGLQKMVSENLGEIDARAVNSIPIGADPNGADIVVRVGKYGPYVQRGEETATVPESLSPDELNVEKALAILSAPTGGRTVGTDPESGLPVLVRAGRYGAYVQLGEASDDGEKPKTASLLSTMSPDNVTLEDALKLLSLPRSLGADPKDGEPIVAQNGRYGPYIQKGKDSRSLANETELFTVTLDQALALLAQPKIRGARRAAAGPLKELGVDPTSQKAIVLREGKFGLYVTDGETNATLGKADSVEGITPERAQELLAERRERGPSTRKVKRPRMAAKKSSGAANGETKSASTAKKKKAPARKKSASKSSSKTGTSE